MHRGSRTWGTTALSGWDLGGVLQHVVDGYDSRTLPSRCWTGSSSGGGGCFALARICHKDGRARFGGARRRRWAAGAGDGHGWSVVREYLVNEASSSTWNYSKHVHSCGVDICIHVRHAWAEMKSSKRVSCLPDWEVVEINSFSRLQGSQYHTHRYKSPVV